MRALEPDRARRRSRTSKPIKFTTAGRGAVLPQDRRHGRPAEDGPHRRACTWNCCSAPASATSSAARRSPASAKPDEEARTRACWSSAIRRTTSPATTEESVAFDLVAAAHGRPQAELAAGRGGPRRSWPTTGRTADRPGNWATSPSSRPTATSRRRGRWRPSRSARCKTSSTACRWSATRRPAGGAVPEGEGAARRPAGGAGDAGRRAKAVDGPVRPHRAARQAADAHARRGGGVQRRA